MKQKSQYQKVRLALGCISLVTGLLAANFALFNWIVKTDLYYSLGNYSRYLCAYAGFAAMIFGAMMINDFIVFRNSIAIKRTTLQLLAGDLRKLLLLVEDLRKSSSTKSTVRKPKKRSDMRRSRYKTLRIADNDELRT